MTQVTINRTERRIIVVRSAQGLPGRDGATGPAGAPGTPLNPLGFGTWSEIEALTPDAGDFWILTGADAEAPLRPDGSTAAAGDGLLWDGDAWGNTGAVQGPQGEQGEIGPAGSPGSPGDPGTDGREVELQKSATHVQWRYAGGATWTDLIALTDITGATGAAGADGAEVELQVSATHIQWRYVGGTWANLIALSAITGAQGIQGEKGDTGDAGPGVAAGGTTGQVLAKKTNTNYDTEWVDAAAGGGGISDAPSDTGYYARHAAAWSVLGSAALAAIGDFATAAQGSDGAAAYGWGNHASAGYLTSVTYGTTAGTACQGNDARLSDARTPAAHDHASNKLAQSATHESADTDSATTALHHTIGTGANQAAAGNHTHAYLPHGPQHFWIGAGAMAPRTTAGAAPGKREYATNDTIADYYAFDSASEEGVSFNCVMPDDWDRGTLKFKFVWDADTGASANDGVTWGVSVQAISNGDPMDSAFGASVDTDDIVIGVGYKHDVTSAAVTVSGTPALGDLILFEFTRVIGDAQDDMAEDALLLGVQVQYTVLSTAASAW